MRRIFPRDAGSWERAIRRVDRFAGRMNPYLMAVAIALVILDFAALINLADLKNLPASRTSPKTSAGPPLSGIVNPVPPS